jgi:transposase
MKMGSWIAYETAKANGIDPFDYLKKVFEKLPYAESEKDFLELLPVKVLD